MIYVLITLLILSLSFNILLFWYTKKVARQAKIVADSATTELKITLDNLNQVQVMLGEYSQGLLGVSSLEAYGEDEVIRIAISNTNMVIGMCEAFSNTIINNSNLEEIKKQKENNDER